MKTCNSCKLEKAFDQFFKAKNSSDGYYTICKACKKKRTYEWRDNNRDLYNAGARAWGQANPERRYTHEIKRRYGCTLEQYNAMLTAQGGACAICSKLHNPAEKRGRLYVDHCHKSGKVRALLCRGCNSMLGYALDDTRVLAEAIAYLTRHK